MKQLLRTIDGWQFETPLALALAAAAGFAGLAMPHETLGHVPVAGGLGNAGRLLLALLAAGLFGAIGYAAMRSAGKPRTVAAPEEAAPAEEEAEPVSPDRLRRLRRADAHPDAPPRAPIRASRDLGEPFMEIGQEEAGETDIRSAMPDGDYVELHGTNEWDEPETEEPSLSAAPAPFAKESAPVDWAEAPSAAVPEHAPVEAVISSVGETGDAPAAAVPPVTAEAPARPMRESLDAMMMRLSSGLERRAAESAHTTASLSAADREIRPALRDALDELNRLASRRH